LGLAMAAGKTLGLARNYKNRAAIHPWQLRAELYNGGYQSGNSGRTVVKREARRDGEADS